MTTPRDFSIIAAIDDHRGLARGGVIPWTIKQDLAFFRQTTTAAPPGTRNLVFMGRRTWESLPEHVWPLPNRYNVVLSRTGADARLFESIEEVLREANGWALPVYRIYCIGGAQLYTEAIQHPACTELILTRIEHDFGCDLFFPPYAQDFRCQDILGSGNEGYNFRMERWTRK